MKMQRGEIVGYNGCLGYDYHPEDKSMTINEEEAEIVRYIFNRYVEGAGACIIARELQEQGKISKRGKTTWYESSIRSIIRNEKYIGDIMMGKTFTVDPISKRRLANLGEEDKVYIRNHHAPIISKAIYYKAQEIMIERAGSKVLGEPFKRKKYSRQFAFSSIVKCGFCGNSLSRRAWNSGTKYGKTIWHCVAHTQKGSRACPFCKGMEEKIIEDAFLESYRLISKNNVEILDEFLARLAEVQSSSIKDKGMLERMKSEQFALKQRKSKLLDSMLDGMIDKALFEEKVKEIGDSLKQIEYKITAYSKEIQEVAEYETKVENFRRILLSNNLVEVFDRSLFESVIHSVIVGGYADDGNPNPTIITFVYKTGVCDQNELEERILREKIAIDSIGEEETSQVHSDKLKQLPMSVEVFNFEQPYKHFVFDRSENDELQKKLKFSCQVRVTVTI